MNVLYVNHKLDDMPFLREKYSNDYSSFRNFCFKVMDLFGWQDIAEIQKEYDNRTFYGIAFKRMYETNVKEWKKISNRVLERDNYTCNYCGQIGGILEIDHIIPFSKGGSDDLDNLTTACRKCNRQKKDKSLTEFCFWREHYE
nr:MAG TPA: HNH endonuclease [Caudoviricetes sp.]